MEEDYDQDFETESLGSFSSQKRNSQQQPRQQQQNAPSANVKEVDNDPFGIAESQSGESVKEESITDDERVQRQDSTAKESIKAYEGTTELVDERYSVSNGEVEHRHNPTQSAFPTEAAASTAKEIFGKFVDSLYEGEGDGGNAHAQGRGSIAEQQESIPNYMDEDDVSSQPASVAFIDGNGMAEAESSEQSSKAVESEEIAYKDDFVEEADTKLETQTTINTFISAQNDGEKFERKDSVIEEQISKPDSTEPSASRIVSVASAISEEKPQSPIAEQRPSSRRKGDNAVNTTPQTTVQNIPRASASISVQEGPRVRAEPKALGTVRSPKRKAVSPQPLRVETPSSPVGSLGSSSIIEVDDEASLEFDTPAQLRLKLIRSQQMCKQLSETNKRMRGQLKDFNKKLDDVLRSRTSSPLPDIRSPSSASNASRHSTSSPVHAVASPTEREHALEHSLKSLERVMALQRKEIAMQKQKLEAYSIEHSLALESKIVEREATIRDLQEEVKTLKRLNRDKEKELLSRQELPVKIAAVDAENRAYKEKLREYEKLFEQKDARLREHTDKLIAAQHELRRVTGSRSVSRATTSQ